MELQVGVKALIQDEQGRFLMLRRANPYEGEEEPRWGIPGGRINPGEPLLEALAREVKEETGLTLTGTPRLLYAQDILRNSGVHVVRLTYQATAKPGEVKSQELDPAGTGHNEYHWVAAEEVRTLNHDLYLVPVFQSIGVQPHP